MVMMMIMMMNKKVYNISFLDVLILRMDISKYLLQM